jgi:peptidoglycan/xylan/chitin deacetylase (PgdA/CDA1 family)
MMRDKPPHTLLLPIIVTSILLLGLIGCKTVIEDTPPAASQAGAFTPLELSSTDELVIVEADSQTSYARLAAHYWQQPEMASLLANINGNQNLMPGESLVVPRMPPDLGGLRAGGLLTVPVLVYHRLAKQSSDRLTVTKAAFSSHLRYLSTNGYHVISLDRLYDFMEYRKPIPVKAVVLTFDDGWRSFYDIAYPLLKDYGYPATLFVYTDYIGQPKALTWEQIKEMADEGFDIQNHSLTHRNLVQREAGDNFQSHFQKIVAEIDQSGDRLASLLGEPRRYFAYPFGQTDALVISILKAKGYRGGLTVSKGANPFFTDPFRLQRTVIYNRPGLEHFKAGLAVYRKDQAP